MIREVAGVAVAVVALATFAKKSAKLDLVAVAIGALGLIAAVFANGDAGLVDLLRVLVGAAFLGAITDLMLLGHWYLVQPGMTRKLLNELTNAVLVLWPLEILVMMDWVPFILALAASSMIYVSIADLIPGLHKKTELRSTVFQVALIVLGIASVALTQLIVEG